MFSINKNKLKDLRTDVRKKFASEGPKEIYS